jgi:hypothetical protein
MNANKVLEIARKHVGNGAAMESSARLCLADAVAMRDTAETYDEMVASARTALRSLSYSVGIFHADYQRVAAYVGGASAS